MINYKPLKGGVDASMSRAITSTTKAREHIQHAAVSILIHVAKSGDYRKAITLVEGLGDGTVRADSLVAYFAKFGLTQDEDTDEVSKVIIADDSGKILILRRSDEGNMWDLPGGHLKKGEKPEDGAKRETKEETNLDISDLNDVKTHENVHFYKCAAQKGEIQLKKDEHTDFKWINPKEIEQYDMRNHQKDAILTVIPVIEEQNEPYQQFSKATYRKFIAKLGKQGKNKYNVGGVMKKPSTKHLTSDSVAS